MPGKYTYLVLLLLSLAGPLLFSFEKKRIHFVSKWKYIWLPILLSGTYFIAWDSWFARTGVWHFSPKYTLGFNILHLPFEEWLFFIIIPFCCIFLYECINFYISGGDRLGKGAVMLNLVLAIVFSIVAISNTERLYTLVNFTSATLILLFVHFLRPVWLGLFYRGFFFCLIPFFIVNGILTGLPVVTYDPAENLGIRIITIPIEDFVYCLSMLIINIGLYEYLKRKDQTKSP